MAPYDVNQAVKRGVAWHKVPPGAVSFLQRCGGSLNVNVPLHIVFLEGGSLDRSAQGRMPRFVQAEPPSDADITRVLQKISHPGHPEAAAAGLSGGGHGGCYGPRG
jgi:Putative transposase